MIMKKDFKFRHLAQLTIELDSPLTVGCGCPTIMTDSPVLTDINGLPYIPGTSVAGVIRHTLLAMDGEDNAEYGSEIIKEIFGYQERNSGEGSKIIFTDAVMIGQDGQPMDGIQEINRSSEFYSLFDYLPIRQHVCINEKGVGQDGGKFDNEVVYKGTRFMFEIELYAEVDSTSVFQQILKVLCYESFRIGGGTRNGYGKIHVVKCMTANLDLTKPIDLERYLSKSSSLLADWQWDEDIPLCPIAPTDKWMKYTLELHPLDFFSFGSGMGDEDSDSIPVAESVICWNNDNTPFVKHHQVLVPTTSIKGTLSHRIAYRYNQQVKVFAGKNDVKAENVAVKTLFGSTGSSDQDMQRGNVLMSDIYIDDSKQKQFDHVKIDVFTGGAFPGALFQEKCTDGRGVVCCLELDVTKEAVKDENIRKALERALMDVCEGLLPLGGIVNRGNGIFNGKLYKNGELWNQ